jgi:hypothetical protein
MSLLCPIVLSHRLGPIEILLRRDTTENWLKHNPILLKNELSIMIDSPLFKIGDGVSKWADLPFYKLELAK